MVLLKHPNLPDSEPYDAPDDDIVKVLKTRGWEPVPDDPAGEKPAPDTAGADSTAADGQTPAATMGSRATGGKKGSDA